MKLIYKNFKQTRNLNVETFNKGLFTFLTMLLNKVQLSIKPGLLLGVIFVLFTGATYAQELEWAIQSTKSSESSGAFVFSQDIAVDGAGNSYVTGDFLGIVTFGAGEPNETSLTNIDESPTEGVEMDIFVAKYNVKGILQWVRLVGGSSFDFSAGIAVDDVGNSYVTGNFSGIVNFGVGRSTKSMLTANGGNNIFVAKYSADGTFLWVKQTGGSGGDLSGGIAVDGVGNSYVTGSFQGTAIFGAGNPVETTLISERSRGIFVAKYDSDGILRWVKQAVGSLDSYAFSIAVDYVGNSYVTGIVQGAVTFGIGEPEETALTSTGITEIFHFVAKYDPDGRLHWAKQVVGTDSIVGSDVSADAAGNSYVIADVFGTATFGVGEPNETTLTNSGPSADSFVAKYTPDGTLRWAMRLGDEINGFDIAVDGVGNSYVTGLFADTAIFGAGEPNETTLTTGNFFVAKYGSNATLQWAKQAKGSGPTGVGIAVDSAGSSYVTGSFSSTATFGVGEPNETTLTNSGAAELLFVAKYTDSTIPRKIMDIQINSSIDDAEEFPSGSVSLTSRDLEFVNDRGRNQTVGIRFNRVTIPQGATITKAYLQFQVEGENIGSTSLTIKGHAVDDATTFTKTLHDISSRPQTKALVNWNPAPWPVLGEASLAQRTPNIASIIQEITRRPGWSSGNSVAFMIAGTGERSAESFDGDLKGAPVLHVEFLLP